MAKKKNLPELHRQLEEILMELPRSKRKAPWDGANYVGRGKSRFQYLDIPYPILRKCFAEHMPEANAKLWNQLFRYTHRFEIALWAMAAMRQMPEKDQVRLLKAWARSVDNWALSDDLSSVLVIHVERNLAYWKPILLRWSKSKHPWERRQSLVALFYYAYQREKPPPWVLVKKILLQLWKDSDFYVQKGLGWCLREAQAFYLKETIALMEERIESLSAIAWQASTEKLPRGLRQKWKKRRG